MPYDANLDQKVFTQTWEKENERISVTVYSYNNGSKKLQISRENCDAQGVWRFSKLGRLNKEETLGILPLMQKSVDQLD